MAGEVSTNTPEARKRGLLDLGEISEHAASPKTSLASFADLRPTTPRVGRTRSSQPQGLTSFLDLPPRRELEIIAPLESIGSLRGDGQHSPMSEWLNFAPTPTLSVEEKAPEFAPSVLGSEYEMAHSALFKELEQNIIKLLTLNPSRRQALVQHLELLAGLPPTPVSANDPTLGLGRWVEGPRSPAQNEALQTYFGEIATLTLGQVWILKSWSDRGMRPISEKDLGNLNWALTCALKPYLPLDREGWQLTRPNIYSWYKPSAAIARLLWQALQGIHLSDEGPNELLAQLMKHRTTSPTWRRPSGYGASFGGVFWSEFEALGLELERAGSARKAPLGFTPTLREGAFARASGPQVQWVGTETDVFQLILAELLQLWWGPAAPPLWTQGSGLEMHSRDQLSLLLQAPKPTLQARIAEMESCDVAFVFEEKCVRTAGRSAEATRMREQLDALPYFKKVRTASTTLGELQACVALTKLRPGGTFIWGREEPLTSKAGSGVLNALLERGRLVYEWDLSGLSLPPGVDRLVGPDATPFPRYLYVWSREFDVQKRLDNRPVRISAQGEIRSYIQLEQVFREVLKAARGSGDATPSRAGLSIQRRESPTPQREWAERWPDPACQSTLQTVERIRAMSSALASIGTVRRTPDEDPERQGRWRLAAPSWGVWVEAQSDADGRRLRVHELPKPGQDASGEGWMILVSDETWVAPLFHYLSSEPVRLWLETHAERRGERWVLKELTVRSIPVSGVLLQALRAPGVGSASPLPGEWERLASDVPVAPERVAQALAASTLVGEQAARIRASLYVRTARAIAHLKSTQARLLGMVNAQGAVNWSELLSVLPRSELVSVTLHPAVRLTGNIPLQMPILRFDRVERPQPSIVFTTESGFQLALGSEDRRVLEMLLAQLEGITHPTWNDLVQYLKLPRRMELAHATAADVLKSHGQQLNLLKQLETLLSKCELF